MKTKYAEVRRETQVGDSLNWRILDPKRDESSFKRETENKAIFQGNILSKTFFRSSLRVLMETMTSLVSHLDEQAFLPYQFELALPLIVIAGGVAASAYDEPHSAPFSWQSSPCWPSLPEDPTLTWLLLVCDCFSVAG